tara:strand:+ start:449 stop:682 length:234 start_codon:yes stop_codon:yes gene_type:complete
MKTQLIQTEDPRFVRDTHSKALLSTDYDALQRHRKEKLYFQKQQEDINILRGQVEELTNVRHEILEIRGLLKELINK